jgi:AcrR family transcriptional regulator
LARTQAVDYERRREAIVEKAADLFAELGFRGASVSDLAKACNTSKSLIYHYYPSKEDVLYAVMLSHIDQLVEDVEAVLALEKPPREKLQLLLHRFMAHYIGAASRQNVLLNELNNLPDDKLRSVVGKQRIVIDAVQGLIASIDPAMAADPTRARVQTMLLFGMINWTKTWFDAKGPVSGDMIADMAFNLIAPD